MRQVDKSHEPTADQKLMAWETWSVTAHDMLWLAAVIAGCVLSGPIGESVIATARAAGIAQ